MIDHAEQLREEHRQLREHVEHIRLAARELPRLSTGERRVVVARILGFLEGTLVPHALEEEQAVYPVVARSLGCPEATATMERDHDAVRERIQVLAAVDPADDAFLQELLYALHALLSVHFWKEEAEYLPILEREAPVLIHEP